MLNFNFSIHPQATQTILFIHGLFGDLQNLGVLERAFKNDYSTLSVDLRNHGKSMHTDEFNYCLMAADVQELIQELELTDLIVVGHSMGGKVAMLLASLIPEQIAQLIVLDIAPISYIQQNPYEHTEVFRALNAIQQAQVSTKAEAKNIMQEYIKEQGVQDFLLKSFVASDPQRFKFNFPAIGVNYLNILDWQAVYSTVPCLFIRGGLSNYIQDKNANEILSQFPQVKFFTVANAGHWVHADKPDTVIRVISKFIQQA